jgi:lysophospholipase L1-like esterase
MKFLKNISREEFLIGGAVALLTYFLYSNSKLSKKASSRLKTAPKSVLIIGDSISAEKSNPARQLLPTQWSTKLKKELEAKGIETDIMAWGAMDTQWMEKTLNKFYEGSATNGETGKMTKITFKEDFSMDSPKNYDVAIIFTGVNDALNNKTEKSMVSLQNMVNTLTSKGTKVYVVQGYKHDDKFMTVNLMTPTKYVPTKEGFIPLIKAHKQWEEDIPKKIKNATIIPMFDLQEETSDGIHPNPKGHDIILQKVKEATGL